jgi:hypothetical protein
MTTRYVSGSLIAGVERKDELTLNIAQTDLDRSIGLRIFFESIERFETVVRDLSFVSLFTTSKLASDPFFSRAESKE